MEQGLVRVMVVDDHPVVREGIAALISRQGGLEVVATAESGEQALAEVVGVCPDVVVLDYRLPGLNGATTCRRIVRHRPDIGVVVLTSFSSDEVLRACLAAGARGYLCKGVDGDVISHAIRVVASGGAMFAAEVTPRILEWARAASIGAPGDDLLSPLEVEILSMVATGMSNQEIARSLGRSAGTIKRCLHSILGKLGSSRRWEAVAAGIERGVI